MRGILMPTRRVAVYTGTFDPVHLGHLDIIERGSHLFERLVIGVGINPEVPAQPGEVPRPYPTILQQVNGFSDAPRDNRSRAHNRRHQ